MLWLVVVFVLLPIAEIYVVVRVGAEVGALWTIVLLIGVTVVGAWLVKWQGIFILAKMRSELLEGRVPTKQLLDGVMLLAAGVLMLAPGFITDALGVLLLLPPVRAVVRGGLVHRYRGRVQTYRAVAGGRPGDGRPPDGRPPDGWPPGGGSGPVIDV